MRTVLDYVIEQAVGRGRGTIVHRARRLPGDLQVAVKLAADDLAPEHHRLVETRLCREADVLSTVSDPGLAPLLEVLDIPSGTDRRHASHPTAESPSRMGLVLAWAAEGSLADALAAGPLEPAVAIQMAEQVCGGLAALHAAGFAHGDISPGNVLRPDKRRWWLADLGESRRLGARPTGPRRGTEGFMAPEVQSGHPVDEHADVYALGRVLTLALGYQLDESGDDPWANPMHDLLRRATATEPTARPDAAALGASLVEALALLGRPDGPPRPRRPATPPPVDLGAQTRDFDPLPSVVLANPSAWRTRPRAPRLRAAAMTVTLVVLASVVVGAALLAWSRPWSRPAAASKPIDGPPTRATSSMPSVAATLAPREPCPGTSGETPAGSVAVSGDPEGIGCTVTVLWWPDRAEAERPDPSGTRRRFALGRPGDQLLLGDWDDDGRDTPALYRPSTGSISRFDDWARSGEPLTGSVVTVDAPTEGIARVLRLGGPDQIEIDPAPP